MVERGAAAGLTLMVRPHVLLHAGGRSTSATFVARGILGHILFVDSARINLGLVQPDVDVFWDLAPHDLSILDFILRVAWCPEQVSATGADPLGAGKACVGYLTMPLPGGIAHVHVNWLSPTKIRQMVIGGSHRTLVWDDLNPQQRLASTTAGSTSPSSVHVGTGPAPTMPPCPTGSATSGARAAGERGAVVDGDRVRRRDPRARPPRTDGTAGLRVLAVLEALGEPGGARQAGEPR